MSSRTNTTICGSHVIVAPINNEELRASFGIEKGLRTMTCSAFDIGVVRNIIPVHDHLLSLKTESRPPTVDQSALSEKLQCSEYKSASALQRFDDLHFRYLCSVDQMAVFVTTAGDVGMCYSTMNDGRPGLNDAFPSVLKAGDHVVCVYGAGSPVLVRVGDSGNHACLLLPCTLMRDCECYIGQPHPVEGFERISFV
jgi:hypothetical protein